MGLDGGTYITRSDVLRGASWALSTADTSRSSRGGNVQAGTVFKRRRLDPREDKCVFSGDDICSVNAVHCGACTRHLMLGLPVKHVYVPVAAHSSSLHQRCATTSTGPLHALCVSTTARRDVLLREIPSSEPGVILRASVAPRARRAVRWSTCALTGQPLAHPIAADWLGNLFNRDAALEFLLGRAAIFTDDAAQVRPHCTQPACGPL